MNRSSEKKTPMKAREIFVRSLLLQRGLSITRAAELIGVKPPVIVQTLNGERTSRRVENGLCRLVGMSREVLWE